MSGITHGAVPACASALPPVATAIGLGDVKRPERPPKCQQRQRVGHPAAGNTHVPVVWLSNASPHQTHARRRATMGLLPPPATSSSSFVSTRTPVPHTKAPGSRLGRSRPRLCLFPRRRSQLTGSGERYLTFPLARYGPTSGPFAHQRPMERLRQSGTRCQSYPATRSERLSPGHQLYSLCQVSQAAAGRAVLADAVGGRSSVGGKNRGRSPASSGLWPGWSCAKALSMKARPADHQPRGMPPEPDL